MCIGGVREEIEVRGSKSSNVSLLGLRESGDPYIEHGSSRFADHMLL